MKTISNKASDQETTPKRCGGLRPGWPVHESVIEDDPPDPTKTGEQEWQCVKCGYFNIGVVCTRCGHPTPTGIHHVACATSWNQPCDCDPTTTGEQECKHDLAERETACADGMCPICIQAALAAEREASEKDYLELKRGMWGRLNRKQEQLDTAVEALRWLDANGGVRTGEPQRRLTTALSKIGEGK